MASPGQPYVTVKTKRVADTVPVSFDWHDYLINARPVGSQVNVGYVWRFARSSTTNMQYRCTLAGETSPKADSKLDWPKSAGIEVDDGTALWTSEVLSNDSLRADIASYAYSSVPSGPTLTDGSHNDFIYTVLVAGGTSGTSYKIKHNVDLGDPDTLTPTMEEKEAVAVLPVQD